MANTGKVAVGSNGYGDEFLLRLARSAPYLKPERERELLLRWCGDRDVAARDELIAAHMRMVVALAMKLRGFGLPFADLVQEGSIGLMQAADRFELSHEVKFSTYATWWMRSNMQDYVLKNWSVVKMSSSSAQKSLFFNLRRLRARIERAQGANATTDSVKRGVAEAMGIDVAKVDVAWERLSPDASLNAPVGEEEGASSERQDFLPDPGPTPDVIVMERIDGERTKAMIESAMMALNERERFVIESRRLCEDEDVQTLDRISVVFGVTRERVRQIETNALKKLQGLLSEAPLRVAGF